MHTCYGYSLDLLHNEKWKNGFAQTKLEILWPLFISILGKLFPKGWNLELD